MSSISRTISITLVAVAITVLSAGVMSAQGDSSLKAQTTAANKATLYLSRASFNSPTRQGVVEALARINSGAIPIQIDVLISIHGVAPNVAYTIVGSKRPCSQVHTQAQEVFEAALPATAGTDRFLKQTIDGTGSPKTMKSARIFDDTGARVGCMATKLYTLARYP